jgi:hypothetical protein
MWLFVSNYEVNKLRIIDNLFHDRDNLLLYTRKQTCIYTKNYGIKLKYMLLY